MRTEYGAELTHRATEAQIAQLASKQHGIITREQALGCGATRSLIQRRLESGVWAWVHAKVYRLIATPDSWHQQLIAACFAWRPNAVASHCCAACLWCIPGFKPGLPELTVPRGRRRSTVGIQIHEGKLPSADVTVVDAIPVTSAARTLIDIASVVSRDLVEEALDDALRRKIVSLPWLRWRLRELGPRPGVAVIRALVQRRVGSTAVPESVLETKVLREIFDKGGLPKPVIQYRIPDEPGNQAARVDAAYPELRIAIEVESWERHSDRIPWDRDLARRNKLARLGWVVLHITWTDLTERLDETIETIRAVIALRSRKTDD